MNRLNKYLINIINDYNLISMEYMKFIKCLMMIDLLEHIHYINHKLIMFVDYRKINPKKLKIIKHKIMNNDYRWIIIKTDD